MSTKEGLSCKRETKGGRNCVWMVSERSSPTGPEPSTGASALKAADQRAEMAARRDGYAVVRSSKIGKGNTGFEEDKRSAMVRGSIVDDERWPPRSLSWERILAARPSVGRREEDGSVLVASCRRRMGRTCGYSESGGREVGRMVLEGMVASRDTTGVDTYLEGIRRTRRGRRVCCRSC